MDLMIQLVIMAVFGAICASVAHSRGRSALAWFFIGLLLGCIGLIILLVIPNLKLEEERHEQLRRENLRLRERLRKDRQVADQRHATVEQRLAIHDEAEGIDTSRVLGAPEPERIAAAPPVPPPPPRDWYYLVGQERFGPLELGRLKELWQSSHLGPDTLVWAKDMKDWKRIEDVPELLRALRG